MYVATVMYELYFFDQNNGMTFLLNNTYNNKKCTKNICDGWYNIIILHENKL